MGMAGRMRPQIGTSWVPMDSVGCQVKCLSMEELEAALPLKWSGWGGLTGTALG